MIKGSFFFQLTSHHHLHSPPALVVFFRLNFTFLPDSWNYAYKVTHACAAWSWEVCHAGWQSKCQAAFDVFCRNSNYFVFTFFLEQHVHNCDHVISLNCEICHEGSYQFSFPKWVLYSYFVLLCFQSSKQIQSSPVPVQKNFLTRAGSHRTLWQDFMKTYCSGSFLINYGYKIKLI